MCVENLSSINSQAHSPVFLIFCGLGEKDFLFSREKDGLQIGICV